MSENLNSTIVDKIKNKVVPAKSFVYADDGEQDTSSEEKDVSNVKEIKMDLFSLPEWTTTAHCIPANYSFGPGIAREIDKKYDMRYELFLRYDIPNGESYNKDAVGKALRIRNIYNLINKPLPKDKPTYEIMRSCLEDMRDDMLACGFGEVYMPRIGCGRDKLDWRKMRRVIEEVFEGYPITVNICYKED